MGDLLSLYVEPCETGRHPVKSCVQLFGLPYVFAAASVASPGVHMAAPRQASCSVMQACSGASGAGRVSFQHLLQYTATSEVHCLNNTGVSSNDVVADCATSLLATCRPCVHPNQNDS